MEGEDSRTGAFQELPRDSSGPSGNLGITGHGEPNIWSWDNVVAISDVRVRSGMFCLLNFSCPGNSVLPVVGGPYWMRMAHSRGAVCIREVCVCLAWCCVVTLFLRDIGCWRTIDWELGSLGRVHAPCHEALSFCLDVGRIKSRWTVIMLSWFIDALFLQCVGARRTTVSVVALVGVAIQVTGLSDLVGGSTGHSEWMLLMSWWAWLWCSRTL